MHCIKGDFVLSSYGLMLVLLRFMPRETQPNGRYELVPRPQKLMALFKIFNEHLRYFYMGAPSPASAVTALITHALYVYFSSTR